MRCLERARSPTGLLTVKIGEMESGRFIGKVKPDKDVERLARKFRLDDPVASRLTAPWHLKICRTFSARTDPQQIVKGIPEQELHREAQGVLVGARFGQVDPKYVPLIAGGGTISETSLGHARGHRRDEESHARHAKMCMNSTPP